MSASTVKWEEGLPEEMTFWETWLSGNTNFAEERAFRLSSNRPFPWWAKPLIKGNPDQIRMLDVGSGPVTALGDLWDDKQVTIVPIDPLAKGYANLLQKTSITLSTPTIYGTGENLVEQFGENSFDFAYACNSLDHSINPVECYQQMLAVLKPGASLVTYHEANSGERAQYEGVHQWNFSIRESRLIAWNHSGNWDVVENCPDAAHFRIETDQQYIKFTLSKHA